MVLLSFRPLFLFVGVQVIILSIRGTARLTAFAAVPLVQCPNSQTPSLILKGKRFYNSDTGEYVSFRGMAYYPRPNSGELSRSQSVDYYTNEFREVWQRDIEYFRRLNINLIRIYAVDPSKFHDEFMCALQEAGIYVLVGLLADCKNCGLGATAEDMNPPDCYTSTLKRRGHFIIRTFSRYENTMGFSAGNEATIFALDRQANTPCQKKFIRDMREYVASCSGNLLPRQVPVGVVSWDNTEIAMPQNQYFACQTTLDDPYETTEFLGINSYRHCSAQAETVEEMGGYQQFLQELGPNGLNMNIPVFLAEFGCTSPEFPDLSMEDHTGTTLTFQGQRTWLQVDALFSPEFQQVFVGGIVFEYSAEKRIADLSSGGYPWPYYGWSQLNYGVGYLYPVDCDATNITCNYLPYPTFQLLADKYAAVDTSYIPSINEDPLQDPGVVPECPMEYPALSEFSWPTDSDDEEISACMTTESPTTTETTPPTEMPTTSSPTTSPTIPVVDTESPTILPQTNAPTSSPTLEPTVDQTTDAPTVGPTMDEQEGVSTSEPTMEDTTNQPSIADVSSTESPWNDENNILEVEEACFLNPVCRERDELVELEITSCCPTMDGIFLDCCAATEEFCYDESGGIVLCPTMSTSQYLAEVRTGIRDPSGNALNGEPQQGSSATSWTLTRFCLRPYYSVSAVVLLVWVTF